MDSPESRTDQRILNDILKTMTVVEFFKMGERLGYDQGKIAHACRLLIEQVNAK